MSVKPQRLQERLTFQRRTAPRWVDVFSCRGSTTYLRGGEKVIADRLASQNAVVIRIRRSAQALQVEPVNWRIQDAADQIFEVKSIIPTRDGRWLDFTCQTEAI
jgi:hypothetical protein